MIFAVARTVGWVSQWKEMVAENPASIRITRPRQVGVWVRRPGARPEGEQGRPWVLGSGETSRLLRVPGFCQAF